MKKIATYLSIIGFSCFSMPILAQQQQYILLTMLDSLYQINRYTLNAEELYGVDETIELYNIHDGGLILFSVLPDFESDQNWTEVQLESIRHQLLDERAFRSVVNHKMTTNNAEEKKSFQYQLVKSVGGKYFKSNHCLSEFFATPTYPSLFNNPYGTINIGQDTISIRRMANVYHEALQLPAGFTFPLDVRYGSTLMPNRWLLQREYLSRTYPINNEQAYQFWTFTDWSTHDGFNLHRGVDRFVYIPTKGIVGGSYDFYFLYVDVWTYPPGGRKRHTKSPAELWQNVLHEKVMLAEELKLPMSK